MFLWIGMLPGINIINCDCDAKKKTVAEDVIKIIYYHHRGRQSTCPGARERFLLRGGPTNKKNEILIIFKNFTL